MSVSIVSCPKCKTLLLSDTAQCPTCQHVIDAERAGEEDTGPAPPSSIGQTEVTCAQCGESVRRELVRCWKCGSFMRNEIAESYQKMRGTKSPVIYSDAGEAPDADVLADDSDFELNAEIAESTSMVSAEERVPSVEQGPAASETETPSLDSAQTSSVETAPPAETGPATGEQEAAQATEEAPSEAEDHSVATGGEALLDIAMREEAEHAKRTRARAKQRRAAPKLAPGAFIVFCPNGHRIEVQERYRGMTGRCKRCKATFYVPLADWAQQPEEKAAESDESADEGRVKAGKYTRWMTDVRMHKLDPTKLKLKEDSLANQFEAVDVGASEDGLLVVSLGRKAGLFGAGEKSKLASARSEMHAHLEAGKPLADLPAASHVLIPADKISDVQVVQPASAPHESMFAGIDVFGKGRIAVRIGPAADDGTLRFLSFTLSEFRAFVDMLPGETADMTQSGAVPLEDEFTELQCHYSDRTLQVLEHIEYYQADPSLSLELVGRRCQGCGLVVSEDARKKERIGGKTGRGIAKAKCPKCGGKFGDISLYGLEEKPGPASDEQAEEQPAAT